MNTKERVKDMIDEYTNNLLGGRYEGYDGQEELEYNFSQEILSLIKKDKRIEEQDKAIARLRKDNIQLAEKLTKKDSELKKIRRAQKMERMIKEGG